MNKYRITGLLGLLLGFGEHLRGIQFFNDRLGQQWIFLWNLSVAGFKEECAFQFLFIQRAGPGVTYGTAPVYGI